MQKAYQATSVSQDSNRLPITQLWSLCIDLLVIDHFASIQSRENSNTPWNMCKLWQCMPLFAQAKPCSFWLVKKNETGCLLNVLLCALHTDLPSLSIYRCHYCIPGCPSGFPSNKKWKQHVPRDFHRRNGTLRSYHSETSGFRSWWDKIWLVFWRWLTVESFTTSKCDSQFYYCEILYH